MAHKLPFILIQSVTLCTDNVQDVNDQYRSFSLFLIFSQLVLLLLLGNKNPGVENDTQEECHK